MTLSQGYWLADTPCTQALWLAVVGGKNPSHFHEAADWKDRPVERVNVQDIEQFLQALQARLPEGCEAVLPTEAQWEYACRAGTTTAFWWGNHFDPARANMDHAHNGTTAVKRFEPNPWGLFDMHGNVREWCADDQLKKYSAKPVEDPWGQFGVDARVVRGGSWDYLPAGARAAYRYRRPLGFRLRDQGFRLALRSTGPGGAGLGQTGGLPLARPEAAPSAKNQRIRQLELASQAATADVGPAPAPVAPTVATPAKQSLQSLLAGLKLVHIRWPNARRILPARYPSVGLFDQVLNAKDFDAAYAVEALTNPQLRDQLGQVELVEPSQRLFGPGSTMIMAAFTHLNPSGSRFSDGSYGVFYAAKDMATAVAEAKHTHGRFLSATKEPAMELKLRAYNVSIAADLFDLRSLGPRSVAQIDADMEQLFRSLALNCGAAAQWAWCMPVSFTRAARRLPCSNRKVRRTGGRGAS